MKERWWTILRGRCFLGYLALHKHILAVLKVATNVDTTVENAYTVKSTRKCGTAKKKLTFSSRLRLRCHIARLGTFSVDPSIVVSFCASSHHPYTTLAIDKWMIFWPSKDSPVEVGSTECSCHLVFESSLHVRLLQATLQYIEVDACSLKAVLPLFPQDADPAFGLGSCKTCIYGQGL